MSYSLHWSNHTIDAWKKGVLSDDMYHSRRYTRTTPFDYTEKIGSLTPALSVQEDVLFPNAYSNVVATNDESSADKAYAVGCKGNQLDNEFPLKNRTPTCVPLVQYPTPVNSDSKSSCFHEQDICALPILNWESYIKNFKSSAVNPQTPATVTSRNNGPRKLPKLKPKDKNDEDDLSQETKRNSRTRSSEIPTNRMLMEKLFETGVNMEKLDESIPTMTKGRRESKKEATKKFKLPVPEFKRRPVKVYPSTLKRYKNVPSIKVQGTWNFLYNQKGACEWTYDSLSNDARILLVGKGSKLRSVRLIPSSSASMISYAVNEIWDEKRPETNTQPDAQEECLNDSIFQIVAHRKESFAAVRRGTTIDLYNTVGTPSYLSSIPIRGYYSSHYGGFSRDKKGVNLTFSSFDLNPYNPCEVVTLDQNYILQHHNIVVQKSTSGVYTMDSNVFNMVPPTEPHQFTLNNVAGLTFANDSSTIYFYHNSKVYFYDRRHRYKIDGVNQKPDFHPLLDLGNDKSSIALSDQRYFTTATENKVQEYISCVQRSQNSNYYYVGTSCRIFLMDWRVPKYPVIKLSHGMRSPAAYIDTNYDENFEVVVAGSQRGHEIFSAVLDYAHISCVERPECKARNPILLSYPRHLSNSRDFIDTAFNEGYQFAWENENNRVVGHCHAWCTGLSICTLPKLSKSKNPPGCGVISTNNFGDVFYQEWAQTPLQHHLKYKYSDPKWTNFLEQWKHSMSCRTVDKCLSPNATETSDDAKTLPDCSVIIESNTPSLADLKKMKDSNFNPFKLKPSHYKSLTNNLKPVEENAKLLQQFKSSRAKKFVEIWEKDWKCKTPLLQTKIITGQDIEGDGEETTLNPTDSWQEKNASANTSHVGELANTIVEIKEEVEMYEGGSSDVEIIDSNDPMDDNYDLGGLFETFDYGVDNDYYSLPL